LANAYDPLGCIPSADAIRKRLAETRETARRLGILLRTAEEIERESDHEELQKAEDQAKRHTGTSGKEVPHV
jgi:hypothetical protein